MTKYRDRDLTGNDLALAEMGVSHMINWWKGQPKSGTRTREIAKCEALNKKLSAINSYAYPYESSDTMPLDVGGETIMVLDDDVCAVTRRAAKSAA